MVILFNKALEIPVLLDNFLPLSHFCLCQNTCLLSKLYNWSADKKKSLLHDHGEDQQIGVSEAEPLLVSFNF